MVAWGKPGMQPTAGSGAHAAGSQARACGGGGKADQQPATPVSPPPLPQQLPPTLLVAQQAAAAAETWSAADVATAGAPVAAASQIQQPQAPLQPPAAARQQQGVEEDREEEEEEPGGSVLKLSAHKSLHELKRVLWRHARTPAPRPRLEIDLEGAKYPEVGSSTLCIGGGLDVELHNGVIDAYIKVVGGSQLTLRNISLLADQSKPSSTTANVIHVSGKEGSQASKVVLHNCSVGHTGLQLNTHALLAATNGGSIEVDGGELSCSRLGCLGSVRVYGNSSYAQLYGDVRIRGSGLFAISGGSLVAGRGLVISDASTAIMADFGGSIQVGDGCKVEDCCCGACAWGAGSKVQVGAGFTVTGCKLASKGLSVEAGGCVEVGADCKVISCLTGISSWGTGSCVKLGADCKVLDCKVNQLCEEEGTIDGQYGTE